MVCENGNIIFPQTSTFQGILVTNFVRSFAVFIYYCGDLNFIRNDVTIGFVTGDGLYDVHEATLRSNAVAIACLNEPNSPWVNVVYEVAASNSGNACMHGHQMWIIIVCVKNI